MAVQHAANVCELEERGERIPRGGVHLSRPLPKLGRNHCELRGRVHLCFVVGVVDARRADRLHPHFHLRHVLVATRVAPQRAAEFGGSHAVEMQSGAVHIADHDVPAGAIARAHAGDACE
jgi:hypothetical protein